MDRLDGGAGGSCAGAAAAAGNRAAGGIVNGERHPICLMLIGRSQAVLP